MHYESKIEDHDKRIDKLEQDSLVQKTEIKNLCDNLKSLTAAVKSLCVILGTGCVGLLFWCIQYAISK